VAQAVYKTLKEAIVNGDLKPGQRLVEQKLSDKMQVSRVPVREAIKRLEQRGFVQKLPVRGVIVKRISQDDIREAFGVKAALEGYAARLACENGTQELFSCLQQNIDASMEALKNRDLEEVMRLCDEFYELIYRAAGGTVLHKLITTFLEHIARYRRPRLDSGLDARLFLERHKALLEAMTSGEAGNVERIVRFNTLQGRDLMLRENRID